MGGPLDGTYSVQPRHMKVRYVRNINDRDLETQDENFEYLDHVPTDMSFLIHRTRLAEICRLALDARTPGAPDEDLLDIESAIYLDGLFDKILGQLPPFFQPGAEIPHDGPRCLELQRDTIMLAIHSRWARMHRRYLLSNHKDPRSRPLRERCLKSARISVSVATKMLDPSHVRLGWAQSAQPIPVTHRMGVVVGHLFMGCTMLALIAGPNPGTAGNGDGTDALEIQEELRQACRALTQSGRNSPIAATLVRDLTGVVRQYSGQGVTDGVESHTSQDGDRPLSVLPEAAPEVDPGMVMMPGVMGMDETLLDGGGLEQNGLWTDLLNTMTSTEAWDELFTGLDSYCGTT